MSAALDGIHALALVKHRTASRLEPYFVPKDLALVIDRNDRSLCLTQMVFAFRDGASHNVFEVSETEKGHAGRLRANLNG